MQLSNLKILSLLIKSLEELADEAETLRLTSSSRPGAETALASWSPSSLHHLLPVQGDQVPGGGAREAVQGGQVVRQLNTLNSIGIIIGMVYTQLPQKN